MFVIASDGMYSHPSRLYWLSLTAAPGCRHAVRRLLNGQIQHCGLTLNANPKDLTFSSAPMKRKKGRTDGNKLSPMWYLESDLSHRATTYTKNAPRELGSLEKGHLETFTGECSGSITTCRTTSDNENLSGFRSLSQADDSMSQEMNVDNLPRLRWPCVLCV